MTQSKNDFYDGLTGKLVFHQGETSKIIQIKLFELAMEEDVTEMDVILTHAYGDDYPLLEEGLKSLVLSIWEGGWSFGLVVPIHRSMDPDN